jgi:hypothetical protein
MAKNHHRDVILTVWKTAENLASQMALMTVREVHHGSMTAVPKPEAHPAWSVVMAISVIAPVPSAAIVVPGCQANY